MKKTERRYSHWVSFSFMIYLLTHILAHSFTFSLTHFLIFIHSLPQSLTFSLTHSLTHPRTRMYLQNIAKETSDSKEWKDLLAFFHHGFDVSAEAGDFITSVNRRAQKIGRKKIKNKNKTHRNL